MAAPAEAADASVAAPATSAIPGDFCDQFREPDRRQCRENPGFCEKYRDRREREDCERNRRTSFGGSGSYNGGGDRQCTDYRRDQMPEYVA
jgi:hypothetical protein